MGTYIAVASALLVLLEAYLSWRDGYFWPSQIRRAWGVRGIAFACHGGMWSDFAVLPFLLAYIINTHGSEWTNSQMMLMGVIGFAVTLGNHLLLITGQKIPDPLGWQKLWWSTTIELHSIYMTLYVAAVGLLYFYSNASSTEVVLVSLALGVHMLAGTHVPIGFLKRKLEWNWCPDLLANDLLPLQTSAIWGGLCLCAGLSAGWSAAAWVGASGIAVLAFIISLKGK